MKFNMLVILYKVTHYNNQLISYIQFTLTMIICLINEIKIVKLIK